MDKRHQIFGEICVGLNLGKQKKLWNKGHDGMMVGYSHKNGDGMCRTHDLGTGKHMTQEM